MKSQSDDLVVHHWTEGSCNVPGMSMHLTLRSIIGDDSAYYQDDRMSMPAGSGWRSLFSSRRVER